MHIEFVAASLELIAGTGKVPTFTLRSVDPIRVDGTLADTVNDGRYSVRLSPGQTEWLADRIAASQVAEPSESALAFVAAIREGSVTLPDASRGKRAAKGASILSVLPAMAADNADADAAVADAEADADASPATDSAPTATKRQRRS